MARFEDLAEDRGEVTYVGGIDNPNRVAVRVEQGSMKTPSQNKRRSPIEENLNNLDVVHSNLFETLSRLEDRLSAYVCHRPSPGGEDGQDVEAMSDIAADLRRKIDMVTRMITKVEYLLDNLEV